MTVLPTMHKDLYIPALYLDGNRLRMTDEHKYLGTFVHSSGSDNIDINRQMRSIYVQGNVVISKFAMCTDDVKCQLFKSYCYNMYGCQLWSSYSRRELDKLRVAYNNIFRTFMSIDRRTSVSAAFIDKGIYHFNVLYRKIVYGFKSRISNSDNLLVRTVMQDPFFIYASSLNSKWESLLYGNL